MPSTVASIVAGLAGLAGLYLVVLRVLWLTQDAQEPPAVATTFPFIGPAIGTLWHKSRYFEMLRDRYRAPIYTLRLPGTRLYVVQSPQLITAVQRQSKALTFQAVEDKFSQLIAGLSPTSADIQKREFDTWQNGATSASSPAHTTFKALNPGEYLDGMNHVMIEQLGKSVDLLVGDGEKQMTVKLYEWMSKEITIATTDGVYGPGNPYRSAAVRAAFWEYQSGLIALSLGFLPKLFARGAIKAREFVASAFEKYYESGDYLQGSGLVRQRHEWYTSKGFPTRDIMNLEAANGTAILSNTIPTAFWVVFSIFSNPDVLSACRAEVLSHVIESIDADGTPVRALDISKLKTSCPLLLSAFKEAMRVHSLSTGLRMVTKDTLLDGTYLLKKDNMVMMPGTVQHTDPLLWGPDVASFNYERFAPDPSRKRPRVTPVSFRAFGGGATLCPGRHFATTEVLVFAAMLMLRFVVTPISGTWVQPKTEKAPLTAAMPAPDTDVEVEVTRRKEDVGVKWVFSLTESDMPILLAAEDMPEEGKER